jgi:hypothetical protein
MTSCSALSGTRRFGGTYRLHLQGCRIVSEANALHGVISQKKILFKTTAVKTSNPTPLCIILEIQKHNVLVVVLPKGAFLSIYIFFFLMCRLGEAGCDGRTFGVLNYGLRNNSYCP